MSVDRFRVTEEHIKLIRNINIKKESKYPEIDVEFLFGGDNLYDDVNLILNGKTGDIKADDGFSDAVSGYEPEQIELFDKLISELSTALNIILYCGSFEPGDYIKRHGDVNWIRN